MPKLRFILSTILASLVLLLFLPSSSSAQAPAATRANELRVNACKAQENVIKTRMAGLLRMATNMQEVFVNIQTRVVEYYQNKVLPDGKTLPSYEKLVQIIQTKKDAVDTALGVASQNSEKFSCDTGDPKTALTTFRKDMQSVKGALKEYRTSIKNLIVAIRTLKPAVASPTGGV